MNEQMLKDSLSEHRSKQADDETMADLFDAADAAVSDPFAQH